MHYPQSPGNPARSAAPSRFKVVPLRPRPEEIVDASGGREAVVDLQAPIDCLRSIKSDLEAYYWNHEGDGELQESRRFQISFWIRLITDRTATLEGLLFQKHSSRLVVRGLTTEESAALVDASKVLDQWIHEEETFATVLLTIGRLLAAADCIGLSAAGGTPVVPATRPGS